MTATLVPNSRFIFQEVICRSVIFCFMVTDNFICWYMPKIASNQATHTLINHVKRKLIVTAMTARNKINLSLSNILLYSHKENN